MMCVETCGRSARAARALATELGFESIELGL